MRLHPTKTKIVYCKDGTRRGEHEHTSDTRGRWRIDLSHFDFVEFDEHVERFSRAAAQDSRNERYYPVASPRRRVRALVQSFAGSGPAA
jgi:hypothetical protein